MTDFEKFFAGEFQRLLAQTSVPGMGEASWDRRAAWLLWRAMHPAPARALEFEQRDDGVFADTEGSVFD